MSWTLRVNVVKIALVFTFILTVFLLRKGGPQEEHMVEAEIKRKGNMGGEKQGLDWCNATTGHSMMVPMEMLVEGPYTIPMEDPSLIHYIKTQIQDGAEYGSTPDLSKPVHTGQIGQAEIVVEYYNGKMNGVFIEAGAWDGEYLSNTLHLEINYNWTGLLVEPNQEAFDLLMKRRRMAAGLHCCFSVHRYPERVQFDAADVFGGIQGKDGEEETLEKQRKSLPKDMRSQYPVQCFPLYSVILATGMDRIDLLSLDIEGAEQSVLETVPWDEVDIGMVILEVEHSNRTAVDLVMEKAGYTVYRRMRGQDVVYVKH